MVKSYQTAKALAGIGMSAYKAYRDYKKSGQSLSTYVLGKPKGRKSTKTRAMTRRGKRKTNSSDAMVASDAIGKRNRQYGRNLKRNTAGAWKLLRSAMQHTTYRLQRTTPMGGTTGAVYLQCRRALAAGANDPMIMPVHCFDVTSAINVNNGVIQNPSTHYQLRFTNETDSASLTWETLGQFAIEGTETGGSASFDTYPNGRDLLSWVHFKALFYAPTTRPTKITVSLVQFKDEDTVPGAPSTTRGTAFWQAMTKRLVYNPVEVGNDSLCRKYLRVLRSTTMYMNPKESTNPENTLTKELNLFWKANRICNYAPFQDDLTKMANIPSDPTGADTDFQKPIADCEPTVHWRSRVFLMVQAQSTWVRSDAPTFSIHPSMDFVLRTKHTNLGA